MADHYIALVMTGWMAIIALAALRGWSGWLALKRSELDQATSTLPHGAETGTSFPAAHRIELAHLKERVRKLENIAAGIDP